MANLALWAAPPKGTAAHARLVQSCERVKDNRALRKLIQKQWRRDRALVIAQQDNGAGLVGDAFLRELQADYCNRMIEHGVGTLPSSFNVCEAFFSFVPQSGVFELRPELDHAFSWPDFLAAVTDGTLDANTKGAVASLEDGVIHTFNNHDDPTDVTFSIADGRQFAVSAFCIIRHESEVTVIIVGGLQDDLPSVSRDLDFDITTFPATPGREEIQPDPELERRAVEVPGAPGFWKVIGVTRFDIESDRRHVRYVLHDCGDSFLILTDDASAWIGPDGEFVRGTDEKMARDIAERTDTYQEIFELCSTAIYLPLLFDLSGDKIDGDRLKTRYGQRVSKLSYRNVVGHAPVHVRLATRSVAVLPKRADSSRSDTTIHLAPQFRVETSGFWKALDPSEIGQDRHGRPVNGKTWVTKHLSWMKSDRSTAVRGQSVADLARADGPDPGWIYVMRSAVHQPGVFKVGLTRRTPEERSLELSSNTATPDRLFVVNEWQTSDCREAETRIHAALAEFRINPRREFFSAPLKDIVSVVSEVIEALDGT